MCCWGGRVDAVLHCGICYPIFSLVTHLKKKKHIKFKQQSKEQGIKTTTKTSVQQMFYSGRAQWWYFSSAKQAFKIKSLYISFANRRPKYVSNCSYVKANCAFFSCLCLFFWGGRNLKYPYMIYLRFPLENRTMWYIQVSKKRFFFKDY